MINYRVTVEFFGEERNEFGIPVMSEKTITIYSKSEEQCIQKLDKMFGCDQYIIRKFHEQKLTEIPQ